MKLGRRIAIDPTVKDQRYFWRAAGVRRFAWNWGLARWNEQFARAKAEPDPEKQKSLWPRIEKLKAEWAEVRRKEFPWSLEVTKCAGTQALIELGKAFSRAQKELREAKAQGRKPRKQFGFPKFKARRKTTPSFSIWNDQISLCVHHSVAGKSYSTAKIPNLGWVRLREAVPSMGGILGATISFHRGRWFIAIQYDLEWNDGEQSDKAAKIAQGKARKAAIAGGMTKEEAAETIAIVCARPERRMPLHPKPSTVGGYDLGLIDALVGRVEEAGGTRLVDASRIANPRRLNRTEKERRSRRRKERRLSRSIQRARLRAAAEEKRKRGDLSPTTGDDLRGVKHRLSNRQRRLSRSLAREPGKFADRREDFLHKVSDQVARSAEIVVLEDLHVAGMVRNHSLAAHLSDAAFGKLRWNITYKAEREGGIALTAPRFFPSSKRCSGCGAVKAAMVLSERSWTCDECGQVHDRDENAAANLCWLGQIAASNEPVPAEAVDWAEWIAENRDRIRKWRVGRDASREFSLRELPDHRGAVFPRSRAG